MFGTKTYARLSVGLLVTGLVLSGCGDDQATAGEDGTALTQTELRVAIRGLFEERVAWTRIWLVDTVEGLPGAPRSAERLLRNDADLGAAIVPFYGQAAGDRLTELLDAAVGHASSAVTAARSGDAEGFAMARSAWEASADEVAVFLEGANPAWDADVVSGLLRDCIDEAVNEASAMLEGRHVDAWAAYDRHAGTAAGVADALAAGIAGQFPAAVAPSTYTEAEEGVVIGLRVLFHARATRVRAFLTDAIEGLDALPASVEALRANNRALGDAVRPLYGEEAGDALVGLLDQAVTDAGAAVSAAVAGDMPTFEQAVDRWYDDEEALAEFFAGASPAFSQAELAQLLAGCVDAALAEATARFDRDWTADVEAHDALDAQARQVADALSEGIVASMN